MNKEHKAQLDNISYNFEEDRKETKNDIDNFGDIKKSKTQKSPNKIKKKENKYFKKQSCEQITNLKKVKINKKIEIIDVECWKQYNLEHTANENLEEFLIMEYENNKKKENEKNKNNKNENENNIKRVRSKEGTISCTCIII